MTTSMPPAVHWPSTAVIGPTGAPRAFVISCHRCSQSRPIRRSCLSVPQARLSPPEAHSKAQDCVPTSNGCLASEAAAKRLIEIEDPRWRTTSSLHHLKKQTLQVVRLGDGQQDGVIKGLGSTFNH